MNTFNFKIEDWELIKVNKASVTFKHKNSNLVVYATKRIVNSVLSNKDNVCMLVERSAPEIVAIQGGPTQYTWLATMMTI